MTLVMTLNVEGPQAAKRIAFFFAESFTSFAGKYSASSLGVNARSSFPAASQTVTLFRVELPSCPSPLSCLCARLAKLIAIAG